MLALATPVCGNPKELIGTGDSAVTVSVSGYTPPAVEGTTVSFHCPPGAVLHGINSSTCMENGEWEPAPIETNCLLTGINVVATHAAQNLIILHTCQGVIGGGGGWIA